MKQSFHPFHPPQRTLMGPGPSDVSPRVLAALARPTIGHLDPEFIRLMDELKALLQDAFRTNNKLTLAVSGPGTAGMETCVVNLVEPNDRVIVCKNGVFGGRIASMVERCGGKVILVEDKWGAPVDPQKVEDALTQNPGTKLVAFVHAETSTGARSDAKELAALTHRHGAMIIADTVTSLGGIPVEVDAWGLDAVYSGSQKCLSCTPGLSPLTMNDRAAEAIRARKTPAVSWFLDLNLVMGYWGEGQKRSYHHTAPINPLYALHEALLILHQEGIENAWQRHEKNHQALRAGLEAMGIEFVVPPEYRLPQLNAVRIPEGADDARIRNLLLQEFMLEIGGGLGDLAGRVWRIGLMGHASNPKNVLYCLGALESVLLAQNAKIRSGQAVAAARTVYTSSL